MTLLSKTHGTNACYLKSRCRCEACRAAHYAYHREWERAHQEQRKEYWRRWNDKHRPVCACGALCGNNRTRCRECWHRDRREARQSRRERIAEMWADGMTVRQIAAALDSTTNSIGAEMVTMRQEGWDLPYRYAGYPRSSRS
jgi:DNA-binding NarL/FixJ family response regulator